MEDKTVWRLQEDDFREVMNENYPDMTEEEKEAVIKEAKRTFTVVNWTEHVDEFIQLEMGWV